MTQVETQNHHTNGTAKVENLTRVDKTPHPANGATIYERIGSSNPSFDLNVQEGRKSAIGAIQEAFK